MDASEPRLCVWPSFLRALFVIATLCATTLVGVIYSLPSSQRPEPQPSPVVTPLTALAGVPMLPVLHAPAVEPEAAASVALLPMPQVEEESPLEIHGPAQPVVLVAEPLGMPRVEPVTFPRRNLLAEKPLREQLMGAEEVGLGLAGSRVFPTYASHVVRNQSVSGSKGVADATPLRAINPAFTYLPMREGHEVILGRKAATELEKLSRKLRVYLNAIVPPGPDGVRDTDLLRKRLREDLRGPRPEWLHVNAVPTINQMLMGEDASSRRVLVDLLAAIPEKAATLALVQRAVFDLNPDVRDDAVEALRERDPDVWRPQILKGFRYPWSPPADFAAEALVRLQDEDAVPHLIAELDRPHPGRPYTTPDKRMLVREVIKINHLNNCMLCHPPAIHGNDPVLGVDPLWSLPASVTTTSRVSISQAVQRFSASQGGHDYGNRTTPASSTTTVNTRTGTRRTTTTFQVPILVRADISFLRQDFSVSFPRTQPQAQWPNGQPVAQPAAQPPVRFDYVVRTRPVQSREQKVWREHDDGKNPHRDAVLFALREITGKKKLGEDAAVWREAFPDAEPRLRAWAMVERLMRTEPAGRSAFLEQFSEGLGVEYTWALERAIPKLQGTTQEVARLALAKRMREYALGSLLSR